MVLPVIPTQNLKLNLKFNIQFNYPFDLRIVGVDDQHRKTVFFDRYANPGNNAGTFLLDFPMPISPEKLRIGFENASNRDESAYKIKTISVDYLPQALIPLTPDELEFKDFYLWFCTNASYLPDGVYYSKTGKYWINYMPVIIDDKLGKIETPARIDHMNNGMQIASNQFRTFTIPIRVVIGWHEFFHVYGNTTDEIYCDINALRVTLGLGFPKSECLYAFANIFNDTKQSRQRIQYIQNYINNFKYNNNGRF